VLLEWAGNQALQDEEVADGSISSAPGQLQSLRGRRGSRSYNEAEMVMLRTAVGDFKDRDRAEHPWRPELWLEQPPIYSGTSAFRTEFSA
jgi:hypothetical protein